MGRFARNTRCTRHVKIIRSLNPGSDNMRMPEWQTLWIKSLKYVHCFHKQHLLSLLLLEYTAHIAPWMNNSIINSTASNTYRMADVYSVCTDSWQYRQISVCMGAQWEIMVVHLNYYYYFFKSTLQTLFKVSLYQPTVYLMWVSKQYWRRMHMQSNLRC